MQRRTCQHNLSILCIPACGSILNCCTIPRTDRSKVRLSPQNHIKQYTIKRSTLRLINDVRWSCSTRHLSSSPTCASQFLCGAFCTNVLAYLGLSIRWIANDMTISRVTLLKTCQRWSELSPTCHGAPLYTSSIAPHICNVFTRLYLLATITDRITNNIRASLASVVVREKLKERPVGMSQPYPASSYQPDDRNRLMTDMNHRHENIWHLCLHQTW